MKAPQRGQRAIRPLVSGKWWSSSRALSWPTSGDAIVPFAPSGPSLGGEQNELQHARLSEFVSCTFFDGTPSGPSRWSR